MTAHLVPGTLLNTQPNIQAPDDFYQELVDMHRDLSAQQSALVNAKLMAGLIRNSRLHVFHDGHLFLISNATEAGRVVHDFLTAPEGTLT